MHITLQDQEKIVRKSFANHFEMNVRMTGVLYLTNQRLYFVTHPLNFKHYDLSIPLENIVSVEAKNNLRVFTHGLTITLKNGIQHNFVVWRRKRWILEIQASLV